MIYNTHIIQIEISLDLINIICIHLIKKKYALIQQKMSIILKHHSYIYLRIFNWHSIIMSYLKKKLFLYYTLILLFRKTYYTYSKNKKSFLGTSFFFCSPLLPYLNIFTSGAQTHSTLQAHQTLSNLMAFLSTSHRLYIHTFTFAFFF